MGYSQKALQGVGWNGMLKMLMVLTSAIKIFLLARVLGLPPSEFGLFSLVAISLGLMESITETGINTTIVQSPKSVQYFLDTAWVIAILRGLVISILMIMIGIWMQGFYGEPRLLLLVAVAAFIPLIKGFINPAIVTLHKELFFFRDTLYRFALILADLVAAVVLGIFIKSAFVFVGAMIFAAIFEVIISFLLFADTPRFYYVKSRAQEIFHNAKGLNLSALLGYAVQNIDNLIIGKVVGTTALGLYANSYNLSHKTNVELSKSVMHGTFPVYIKISGDHARLRRAFWRSTIVSMVGFVIASLPFLLIPDFIVSVLLGPNWAGVEQILPWLVVAGLFQSFTFLSGTLFTATKRYFWLNIQLFVTLMCVIPGLLYFGQHFGLIGAVYAVVLSRLLTLPVTVAGLWQVLYKPR